MNRARCAVWMGVLGMVSAVTLAGNLNPPAGPVAPTPGPEPRMPINLTNTPGDANSLFRISTPGSYYLTGNVTGVAGKHGIEIAASGVSVDLMGFDVVGVPGSLGGMTTTVTSLTNIEVRNGSVRTWGGDGVNFYDTGTSNCRLESVRSDANGGTGMRVNAGSIIVNCVAADNLSGGFGVDVACIITGCVSRNNTSDGFTCGRVTRITGCVALENGVTGITVGAGSSVAQCSVCDNDGDGILAPNDCMIVGNLCDGNGLLAGDGAGIHVTGGDTRVEDNNCTDADRGIDVDVAGSIIIRNTCAGNTTSNWDIAANNVCGPILDRTAPASALILGNSAVSSLGTVDPNANFTY